MSETFKGFVKKIGVKEGRGRKGPWALYSAKLEYENGEESEGWISFGFDKPAIKEGDYVKIVASENDRGYLQADSVVRLKNAPARNVSSNSKQSNGAGKTFEDGSVQKSIHYQSSRKDAIEVVSLLLANSALPLTAAKGKAADAKRYEELMALIDKLTVRYFNDAQTQRILETVADEGVVDNDAGELPDDSEKESDDEDEIEEDDEEVEDDE